MRGNQREEAVKIFSNKAECNIRLERFNDASLDGTSALILDKNHVKSLLRRARANYEIGFSKPDMFGMPDIGMLGVFEEDVDKVINMAGDGLDEAKRLKEKYKGNIDPLLNRHSRMGFH